MSEHGFHVHGPHDHELEHGRTPSREAWPGAMAVATAIIATIGAFFAYMGGADAGQRGPVQERVGDQEDRGVEPVELLPGQEQQAEPRRAGGRARAGRAQGKLPSEVERYKQEKAEIKKDAEKLERESDEWEQAQRRADAPASSLGAGDDGAADLDRAGGDRAADAQPRAAVRGLCAERDRHRRRHPRLAAHQRAAQRRDAPVTASAASRSRGAARRSRSASG